MAVTAKHVPALECSIGRHCQPCLIAIAVPEEMVVFADDERLSEPPRRGDHAHVVGAVGKRTHLRQGAARRIAADPIVIGVHRHGAEIAPAECGLHRRPIIVGADQAAITETAQDLAHACGRSALGLDEEGLKIAHARTVGVAVGGKPHRCRFDPLVGAEISPGTRERFRRSVARRKPAVEWLRQRLVIGGLFGPLMHDAVELHAVFIGKDHQRERVVADGRRPRIGIDAREKLLLQLAPVRNGIFVEMQPELEIAVGVPSIVMAAIGAARRREPVDDPVDAVALQRRQQVMDAIQRLRIEIEILLPAEHQAGIDKMQPGDVVSVHRKLAGIALGAVMVRKTARSRAPGERRA